MMPDLGRYAAEVLSAYAATLALLALLVAGILLRARAIRRRLACAERDLKGG